MCLRAELMLRLGDTESCIKISASQKREKWKSLYFLKRAAFFSLVNSLNEIYRYEYIL